MTAKQAFTVLGVVFAAVISAYFLLLSGNERGTPESAVSTSTVVPGNSAQAGGDKVIAYYFHVTVRCDACSTIERYSAETIKGHFGRDMAAGRLEWRPVNVQLAENRHFIKDYNLFTRSLVLVLVRNGQQEKYTNLDKTWELVWNKAAFEAYVKDGVNRYLGELR